LQREIGGEVTVSGLLRALEMDRRFGDVGRDAAKRGPQQFGELSLGIGAHGTRRVEKG
jgi:hypothetical protein